MASKRANKTGRNAVLVLLGLLLAERAFASDGYAAGGSAGGSTGGSMPATIRANNPVALLRTGINWVGEIPGESDFQTWEMFDNLEHGWRAGVLNTDTLIDRAPKMEDLIRLHTWGKTSGAYPENYISFVTQQTGDSRNTIYPTIKEWEQDGGTAASYANKMWPLYRAIAGFESGSSFLPYWDQNKASFVAGATLAYNYRA